MDIKVIFLQKTCAICLVMYHLDVYKHKSVTFNQMWYLYFCWNAVLLGTGSWCLSCISGLTCLFYNSLLRTLSSAFQYAACVRTCARVCQGEGCEGEKEEEPPVMLILQIHDWIKLNRLKSCSLLVVVWRRKYLQEWSEWKSHI